jgi:hypothetical protein
MNEELFNNNEANAEYAYFREIIKEIVDKEVQGILKKENLHVSYTGTVTSVLSTEEGVNEEGEPVAVSPFSQYCSVDLVFTTVDNVKNKSGELLSVGDTVIVYEKKGSLLSDCYIGVKN